MTPLPSDLTTSPLSYAEAIPVEPEYIRLPKSGERDPMFSLSRGYLNLLVLPCKENNYRPPVKSCVLRRRGAKTGVRLINVKALRHYIERHAEPSAEP